MPYPAWTLGLAAILATSSLVPIIIGLVRTNQSDLEIMCFSLLLILLDCYQVTEALKGQDRAEVRTNKFYRVDTAASTRPMLGEFQV